jgi:hypothetical protein
MKTIKGPALFLAQFAGDEAPFNSWDSITKWAADCGYKGVQIPSWDTRLFDLKKASESRTYCDEIAGIGRENGVEITELSTHLQGQLVAVHPAYDVGFDGFAVPSVHGDPKARQAWAVYQVKLALTASRNFDIGAHVTFSGALAWPYIYPWPQRPVGLVEAAFDELAKRWRPILDHADDMGVTPVKTCMTASRLRCFWTASTIIRAAICCMIRRITSCNALIILTTSTSTKIESRCSTSRMLNLIQRDAKASMAATSRGLIALAVSGPLATGKLILALCSQRWQRIILMAGPWSNGNAPSNIPKTVPAKARNLSKITSSA